MLHEETCARPCCMRKLVPDCAAWGNWCRTVLHEETGAGLCCMRKLVPDRAAWENWCQTMLHEEAGARCYVDINKNSRTRKKIYLLIISYVYFVSGDFFFFFYKWSDLNCATCIKFRLDFPLTTMASDSLHCRKCLLMVVKHCIILWGRHLKYIMANFLVVNSIQHNQECHW